MSDLHLGTAGCQAVVLLDFLKHHPSHTLYLVGDIIDGWQLRRKWSWPQAHNDVAQRLLRRAREVCRVVFVPGYHDEVRASSTATTSAAWKWPTKPCTPRPTASACGWCMATISTP